jgi:23S rRNA pseudouridine2605 synthase
MAANSTPKGDAPEGDRIAKVLSRRGVASRREAERLIEAGEVKVNGKIITSPALNVTDADIITISGHPLPALEPARLWLYYKPEGLVTSASDEKGRDTVFDHLPQDMPRVMSVGRLDLNSEGLLLLTNDGELKRRLELPSTGWLRKYRVRIKGNPTDPELEPLRKGIEIEGERFQPMSVVLDRHQGANSWLTIGLREGKNREIRRAIDSIGLIVNRLIRVSYGPFRLGELKPGEVEEVRQKVLREQLGSGATDDGTEPAARKARPATATRRLRPGEGIKALAKAWDEATAAKETVKSASPKRSVTTRSAPRRDDEDRAPRPRSTDSRAPRAGDDDRPARRSPRSSAPAYGDSATRSTARPRNDDESGARRGAKPSSAPRGDSATRSAPKARRDEAPRNEDRARTAKPYATSRAGTSTARDEAPRGPRSTTKPARKDSAPRKSDDDRAKPASRAKAAAPAARKIAGPKPSAPRPSGPSAPKKPPSKPRKP